MQSPTMLPRNTKSMSSTGIYQNMQGTSFNEINDQTEKKNDENNSENRDVSVDGQSEEELMQLMNNNKSLFNNSMKVAGSKQVTDFP